MLIYFDGGKMMNERKVKGLNDSNGASPDVGKSCRVSSSNRRETSGQPLWLRQLKAIPETINRSQDKWFIWAALGYAVFGVLLALILPEDGFTRFSLVDVFCSKMEMLVPSIEKYEKASNFKNVTRTVMSVMWALFPIMSILVILSLGFKKVPELVLTNYWRQFPKVLAVSIFAIILSTGLIYFFVALPIDVQETINSGPFNRGTAGLRAMGHSKFWLGVIFSWINIGTAGFVWVLVANIYALMLLVFGFFINFYYLFVTKEN
jgi:hypothetical protein